MNAQRARDRKAPLPPPPGGRHRADESSFVRSFAVSAGRQPAAMLVLRAFLGATFVYAGVQKLADPSFLHPGSLDFVGRQLRTFAQGSPIGALLRYADRFPVPVGMGVALAEIAVGFGTLGGIAPLLFAAVGFLINLSLTLSATWHVHPYFLGSDSMYAVAWLAYLVGVAESRRRTHHPGRSKKRQAVPAPMVARPGAIGRRELLRGSALAGATLLTASAAAALEGSPAAATSASRTPPARQTGSGTGARAVGGSTGAPPSAGGTAIASLDAIPVGRAIGFNAPGVGPAALVRLDPGTVVAYSRVCTHAGCLVGYDPSSRVLVCPCHGAEFDPARNAEVIAGPAPSPLPPIQVAIDQQTGEVIIPR